MPEWAWPSNNNWRVWCVSRFHVNKNIKQTYKGGLHFTVICCPNKCIINERYIPEHQNKLNIYDLQNYEFSLYFTNEKIRKIRIRDLWCQTKESPHLESFCCIEMETIVYYRITQQITDRLTSLKMDNMHNTSTNLLTSQLKHCTYW